MENRKPLNFAQALRSKPGAQETPEREQATNVDSPLSTKLDSQQATTEHSQIPPPSLLSTERGEPAIQQAPRRAVASHKRRKADSRKGDRHRGEKVPFNNRLNAEIVNRIKHFCVDNNLEQQEFAELAAIHFMDAVDSRKIEKLDSKIALDDRELMILFKTSPTIINLYLQYNPENRWKPADDYEGDGN